MKKTKATALIAASFAVAMGLTACIPPEESGDPTVRTKEETSETTPDVQVEYGAPIEYDDPDVQTDYGAPTDYDPSDEDVQDVYGPPADFDEDDEVQGVYGPPSDYVDETEEDG